METNSPESPPGKEQKEQNLIQKALKEGRSIIHTWTAVGAIDGSAGYKDIGESNPSLTKKSRHLSPEILLVPERHSYDEYEKEWGKMAAKGIFELAAIVRLTEDVVETRTKEVPNRIFFKKKVEEKVVSGKRNLTMKETAGDGGEEPAAAIEYYASVSGQSIPYELRYLGGGQRPGNKLAVEIIIPLRLAEEISAEIERNPTILRKLVETFIREKYSQDFVEQTWNRWGRPPFEAWDASETGSKLYFVDLIKEPEAEHLPVNDETLKRAITISPGHPKATS